MTRKLRVALVCDWLTEIGGAEQVLLELCKIFPDAPIYTSQYRPKTAPWFTGRTIKTGWLNIFPRCLRKFLAPLRVVYFNHLKITGFDVIISVCNAEAKGIKVDDSTLHIAYLQGPPIQYYWGMYNEYIDNPGFGKLNWLARLGLKLWLKPMRRADLKASQRPDVLLANSHYVADEIKKYYHRGSRVVFPPVDVSGMIKVADKVSQGKIEQIRNDLFNGQDFYVVAGRQVNWKRVDLAVSACVKAVENLLVIGEGPEHEQLVSLANGHDNIKFLPRYNGAPEIAKYFRVAKAFIFPSLEPFGIVPVEALATGLPVIAYNQGGSVDMVEDGWNGILFDKQTPASLMLALERFNKTTFDVNVVKESAEKFSAEKFATDIYKIIDESCEVK